MTRGFAGEGIDAAEADLRNGYSRPLPDRIADNDVHDEWQVSDRRYLSKGSMARLNPPATTHRRHTGDEEDVANP